MLKWGAKFVVDLFFAGRVENRVRETEILADGREAATRALSGPICEAENVQIVKNRRNRCVLRRSWRPRNRPPLALVCISHGFTEHSGNYNALAHHLAEQGFRVICGDFVGHGGSDKVDGLSAFIPDFEECVEDLHDHVKAANEDGLAVFGIGHSMGGMLLIRTAIDHPGLFEAIVLDGPLIYAGPSEVLRNAPMQHLIPCADTVLQFVKKHAGGMIGRCERFQVGATHVENITTDPYAQELLRKDQLRHFGGVYVGMLLNFCHEMNRNLQDFSHAMTTPFLTLFGSSDALCNVKGAWDMFYLCHRLRKEDKQVIEFPHGGHQLYLEIPQIREKAIRETTAFILRRLERQQMRDLYTSEQ